MEWKLYSKSPCPSKADCDSFCFRSELLHLSYNRSCIHHGERKHIQKKQICLMRYIFGTNFSVKLRRKWLCLVAPPEGTVALSSIILAFIFIVKQSWKQIKWAERTQKKGASLPVKNGTHSKPERVVSVGFLCFILLNFSLIAA